MININILGKLDMDDNGEFIVHIEDNHTINITNILMDIFTSQLVPQVYVKLIKNNIIVFEEDGQLVKNIDRDGVDSFYICGENLDYKLFYNTGENIEIIVKKRGNSKYNGKKS